MTTKVIGFVGSPRKGGNTDLLVQVVLKGAEHVGAVTSIYYLHDYKFSDCRECKSCKKPDATGCIVDDDMQQFYPVIREADVIVFGSPFWFGYMTGQAKTFLDRWYCFLASPNPLAGGKRFILVLPLGRNEPDLFRRTAKWMAGVFPFAWPGSPVDILLAPGVMEMGDVNKHPEYLEKAYKMGRQIIRSREAACSDRPRN
jgi:hypothetical protein